MGIPRVRATLLYRQTLTVLVWPGVLRCGPFHTYWKVLCLDASRTWEHSLPTIPPQSGSVGTGGNCTDPLSWVCTVTLLLVGKLEKANGEWVCWFCWWPWGHLSQVLCLLILKVAIGWCQGKLCQNMYGNPAFSLKAKCSYFQFFVCIYLRQNILGGLIPEC